MTSDKLPTKFEKIQKMNVFGAGGLIFLGVALFFNKIDNQPASILITIVVMYAILVAVPALTARALSIKSTLHKRVLMIWANWFLIAIWFVGFLMAIYMHVGIAQAILGIFMFVVPETLNILALRKLNQQSARSQTNLE